MGKYELKCIELKEISNRASNELQCYRIYYYFTQLIDFKFD